MNGLIAEHIVCRTVRDAATMLDVTHGPADGDPYPAPPVERPFAEEIRRKPKKLRIGFATRNMAGDKLAAECAAAARHAAKLCEDLGHEVEEASPPVASELMSGSFMAIWAAGLAQQIDMIEMVTGAKVAPENLQGLTRGLLAAGRAVTAGAYLNAVAALQVAARAVAVDTETSALDAMRAELTGVSLALGPNDACYIPLGHGGNELRSKTPWRPSRRSSTTCPSPPCRTPRASRRSICPCTGRNPVCR